MSSRETGAGLDSVFEWPAGTVLRILGEPLPRALQREIGAWRSASPAAAPQADLIFCRSKGEWPVGAKIWQGRYKGMAWQIALSETDGRPRYFFYAPTFGTFLFIRTCLLPVLKKRAIEKGGFLLIGSAFTLADRSIVLFGGPGSGKTRLLLEALDSGARLLADSEIMLAPDNRVLPVFPYLEARFRTVAGTSYWKRLSAGEKIYLWACQALSRLSGEKISFNLLLHPVDLVNAARAGTAPEQRLVFIRLQKGARAWERLGTGEFLAALEAYETTYQDTFGRGIYTPEILKNGLSQARRFLLSSELWQAPAAVSAAELFAVLNLRKP